LVINGDGTLTMLCGLRSQRGECLGVGGTSASSPPVTKNCWCIHNNKKIILLLNRFTFYKDIIH